MYGCRYSFSVSTKNPSNATQMLFMLGKGGGLFER
jgi:hypothetical protein